MHNTLDELWENISALGGSADLSYTDEYARGCNETVGVVLDMIEKMGGMDPEVRKQRLMNLEQLAFPIIKE